MKELLFRTHAIKRMAQRDISKDDILTALENGHVIMYYADDKPFASQMVLGYSGRRPLHILIAEDSASTATIVITVYEPDPDRWNDSYEERKQQ